jgi:hypothetical protein
VLAQDLAGLDVIVIDDGSTDGSGAVVDEYAAGRGWQVVHQENSGWPGRPRKRRDGRRDRGARLLPRRRRRTRPRGRCDGWRTSPTSTPATSWCRGWSASGGREVVEEVYEATVPEVADRARLFGR